MAKFDPSTKSVDEVLKKLESASDAERQEILLAEQGDKRRKTILEPYGLNPDARVDATGRELYPWEVDPEKQVFAVVADETDEQREYREQQAKFDERIAAATSVQPAATAPGSGVAPAGVADAGGDAGLGGV